MRWPLWSVLVAATLVLGYLGFAEHYASTGEEITASSLFYLTLGLFAQKFADKWPIVPWQLDVARFAAPILSAYAGVAAATVLLRERIARFRMRFLRNHTVVCGLGRMGYLVASRFAACGRRVVVIELDPAAPLSPRARESGCTVLVGDARDPAVLRRARVDRAEHLICLCGADGTNAEIVVAARETLRGREASPLLCSAHITDVDLWNLLREREIATEALNPMRLEFFNVFDAGARAMLEQDDRLTDALRSRPPKLAVVGLGQLGMNLVAQASRTWWGRYGGSAERLCIVAVDLEATRKVGILRCRYSRLDEVADIDALDMDVDSAEFECATFLEGEDGCDTDTVYVCFDDDARALGTALRIRQHTHQDDMRIVVRMAGETGLARLVDLEAGSAAQRLTAFPLVERICTPECVLSGIHERLARACHEDYVQTRRMAGDTIGANPSMVPWDRLPEPLRESSRAQADDIGRKLASIGIAIAPLTDWGETPLALEPREVERLAIEEHERFVAERLAAGWRLAPPPKNVEAKTSPYLVPWNDLEDDVKEIDRQAVLHLPLFLAAAGFKAYRTDAEAAPRV